MIVHLHQHSEYSASAGFGGMDGFATVDEIGDRALELESPAQALSDHGVVAGHLAFDKAMRERDIKPIFAMEAYLGLKTNPGRERDNTHLMVGALNDEGLKNLWQLSDDASTNAHHVDRITYDMLRDRREGLWVSTACIASAVSQELLEHHGEKLDALNTLLDIMGDDVYFELHTYPGEEHELLNQLYVQLGDERGIPYYVACDGHYAYPDQYELHDAYLAMQTKQSIYAPVEERKMWHPPVLYMQDESEVHANLDYLGADVVDRAIGETVVLAERCNASLPPVERHLPAFIPPESEVAKRFYESIEAPLPEDPDALIWDLAERGLYERYAEPGEREWDRFEHEMEIILEFEDLLVPYLLQTWEYHRWCEEQKIERNVRGSAAGSLVSYCLRISDADPLHYDLLFERFFNPGRVKGFPDIDTDLGARSRPRVRDEFLKPRWGEERVAPIGNVIRMKPLGAMTKSAKSCGVTDEEMKAAKKIVENGTPDYEIHNTKVIGWDPETEPGKQIYVMTPWNPDDEPCDHGEDEECKYCHKTGERLLDWVAAQPADRRDIIEAWLFVVQMICSRIASYGVHAAGTVVSDIDLGGYAPRRRVKDKETGEDLRVTQFPMDEIEALGLCKQDLLVVRNLDTLEEWNRIREAQGKGRTVWSGLDLQPTPQGMWEMLWGKKTRGVFQLEQPVPSQMCADLRPEDPKDLSLIVALDRPGPLRANVPARFIARRAGEEEVTYPDPFLEPILNETYGFFIYQEDVMRYFAALGYDLSDTDAVRKMLGKKLPVKLAELRNGKGEWEGKGYLDIARGKVAKPEQVFKIIEGFASYSFNKAHSVTYGSLLAFRTAYAKFIDPATFTLACIRTNPKEAGLYIAEARRFGIKVLPPDIMRSQAEADIVDGEILYGLADIKTVKSAGEYVVELRESGYDLSSPELLQEALAQEKEAWQNRKKEAKAAGELFTELSPNTRCKVNVIQAMNEAGAWENYQPSDLGMRERQKLEEEYLGIILTDDSQEVLDANASEIDEECDEYGWDTLLEPLVDGEATKATIPAIVSSVKEVRERKAPHKEMGIVGVEYEGRDLEFAVFARQWKAYRRTGLWRERTPGIFTVVHDQRTVDGEIKDGYHLEEARKLTR